MGAVRALVRHAVQADCAALISLIADHARFEHSQATITPPELFLILASNTPPVTIFVGARGRELLGYAALTFDFALWRARGWAHLDCLFVRKESRGLGIGAMLLGAATDHASALGADRMEWQTPAWNERAIEFYRRVGAEDTAKVRFTLSVTPEVWTDTQCKANGDEPVDSLSDS